MKVLLKMKLKMNRLNCVNFNLIKFKMEAEKIKEKINNNNNIKFNKLQGFDVIEKLPEEKFIDNYNEQFYSN